MEKILNPSYLDGEKSTFGALQNLIESLGTSATAWVGESGGAYNSGHHLVSDAFVYSFWLVVTPCSLYIIRCSLKLHSLMLLCHKQVFGSAWHVSCL